MSQIGLVDRLFEISLPLIAKECGLELVDVEYVKEGKDFFLRFFIDKEEGVSLDDCQKVSTFLNPLLDKWEAEQLIKLAGSYHLEVSSPGIERKLKRPRDFQKSIGKFVEVRLFKAFEGKKKYRGILVNFDEASNEIEILVDEERLLSIAKEERSKVSLFYEF